MNSKDDTITSLSDSLLSISISAEGADESKPLDGADTPFPSTSVSPSPSTRKRERGEEELLPQPPKPSQSNQPSTSALPGPSRVEEGTQQSSQKVKFVINVPMWVPLPNQNHPETDIMSQCQKFLDLLETTGFNEEDQVHLKDVAIIIGLNGEDHPERKKVLEKLLKVKENTKCMFAKISFTWGPQGDIVYKRDTTPFQHIREYLKNHEETKMLVREIQIEEECLVYFSFIDADTVSFNQVYSSYLQIVQEHSNDHAGPPTVMSTGYEFPDGKFKEASQVDREVRIATAKAFPLGTYYPEPNFCVLLPQGEDTLPESFIDKRSQSEIMESPVLIRQVKKRDISFSAVFTDGKPIITTVPPDSTVDQYGLTTTQSHLIPYVWATSAYTHLEVKFEPKSGKKRYFNARGFLIKMLTCDDEEFENKCSETAFPFTGPGVRNLIDAARSVRQVRGQLMKDKKDMEKAQQSEL